MPPCAAAVVAADLREPLEGARDRAASGVARIEFADDDSAALHAASRAAQELVLFGQWQVVQNVDQEHRVEWPIGQREQIERFEFGVLPRSALRDGDLAGVQIEAQESAAATQLPQK